MNIENVQKNIDFAAEKKLAAPKQNMKEIQSVNKETFRKDIKYVTMRWLIPLSDIMC